MRFDAVVLVAVKRALEVSGKQRLRCRAVFTAGCLQRVTVAASSRARDVGACGSCESGFSRMRKAGGGSMVEA